MATGGHPNTGTSQPDDYEFCHLGEGRSEIDPLLGCLVQAQESTVTNFVPVWGLYLCINSLVASTVGRRGWPRPFCPPSWRTILEARLCCWFRVMPRTVRTAISSAPIGCQSFGIMFHWTGVRPSDRAMLRTAGRRAPWGARK